MTRHAQRPAPDLPRHPFDDDKLHEECGVYGVFGAQDAASFVALGLHALQHRGQEAAGIAAWDPAEKHFNTVRRMGYVRDNFTSANVIGMLPGRHALGHVRYSTAGKKGVTAIRDVQPLYAELSTGGFAIAHNGNLTNADALRSELIERGSIFQSSSDTECIVHLMALSIQRKVAERMKDALRRVEGAFSVIAITRSKMIGVRDPLGVRPLVLGKVGDVWVLSSETCALDIVGAELVREVEPGEMVIVSEKGVESQFPFGRAKPRFCIFEYVYFSRPDSVIGGLSVYETRRRIGAELAREAPVEADLICPVPDSGTPAAIGYSQQSGIPYAMGIIRNQYVGRTFIEPSEQIRNMGVRLKLNVNRAVIAGKRVVLVDDSVVRGTTSLKIKEMVLDAGAAEVHLRIASPPTMWPCFYGVDTPDKDKLLAAQMTEDQMRAHLGVDSIRFISLDGLYRACGEEGGRDKAAPQFCDACFSGDYPIAPSDRIAQGRITLAAGE
ncbi:MAG: amidophosphoribosyltransferase [Rhodobacterales bacterium CG18_big_fil_WC_8_21_14_2_50_71_9]|nr:MAG: amidophosphoribosyltransferase [Rhodobacterales bacterium CG18_big_fil_WC_8_21_14_2_50_71_9]PIY72722.1 MAG: amidophosphoribosyltransferase [Rhodobacterales bacterium CG_4_10_14_0_8_um_filter_70_9]